MLNLTKDTKLWLTELILASEMTSPDAHFDRSSDNLLQLNVRGRVFELNRDSLLRQPGSRLYQIALQEQNLSRVLYFNR